MRELCSLSCCALPCSSAMYPPYSPQARHPSLPRHHRGRGRAWYRPCTAHERVQRVAAVPHRPQRDGRAGRRRHLPLRAVQVRAVRMWAEVLSGRSPFQERSRGPVGRGGKAEGTSQNARVPAAMYSTASCAGAAAFDRPKCRGQKAKRQPEGVAWEIMSALAS